MLRALPERPAKVIEFTARAPLRAYILIEARRGYIEVLRQQLLRVAGVVFVDALQGPADLIAIVEGPSVGALRTRVESVADRARRGALRIQSFVSRPPAAPSGTAVDPTGGFSYTRA
jgi:hypothetical protein